MFEPGWDISFFSALTSPYEVMGLEAVKKKGIRTRSRSRVQSQPLESHTPIL